MACKVTNLPLALTKMRVLCSTYSLSLDMIVHLLQTHQEKSVRRLSMLDDWHYETSSFWIFRVFFSFFTGRVLSLKLIRLNRHDDRFCRSQLEACFFFNKNTRIASRQVGRATLLPQHPREPFTPLKMADPGSFNLSFSIGLIWAAKKST